MEPYATRLSDRMCPRCGSIPRGSRADLAVGCAFLLAVAAAFAVLALRDVLL